MGYYGFYPFGSTSCPNPSHLYHKKTANASIRFLPELLTHWLTRFVSTFLLFGTLMLSFLRSKGSILAVLFLSSQYFFFR